MPTKAAPVVLHLGFDPPDHERAKAAAESSHQKTTEFCRQAVTMLSDISPCLREQLLTFADRLRVRPGHVLDSILAFYFAHTHAREDVWGESGLEPSPEFTVLNGHLVTGETLMALVQEHLTRQYEADRERAILFEHYICGNPPTEAEAAFCRTRGPLTIEEAELREQLAQRQRQQATLQELESLGYVLEGLAPRHRRVLIGLYQQVKDGAMGQSDFDEVAALYRNPETRSRGAWTEQAPSTSQTASGEDV